MLEKVRKGIISFMTSPSLDEDYGFTVAFTGRIGGSSSGPYSSLNVSYDVGDARRPVESNRKRIGDAVGVTPDHWVLCQQVHGCRVGIAGPLEKGRGGRDHQSALPRCDGLVTAERGVMIGVLTADCLPVVVIEPARRVVGVAHAGWRGLLAGVVPKTIKTLMTVSGSGPGMLLALLGPHIRACCFKTGEGVAGRFRRKFEGDGVVVSYRYDAAGRIDLAQACRKQLTELGLRAANVHDSCVCTSCDDEYFSFRKSEGLTGRQAALVAIRD